MTLGETLGEHLIWLLLLICFMSQCKDKTSMEVAASNINIKKHQLFSKQRVLGVYSGKSQGT